MTHSRGIALVLASTLGFAAMGPWAKAAYTDGWRPEALVSVRFALVALALWAVALARPGRRRVADAPRAAAAAFLLGLSAYALENHLYFAAVARLDAGLLALVMSVYPALVVGGAVALGRERADRRRLVALATTMAGALLVLAGGAGGGAALDAAGVLLALGSATAYATYLLAGDRLLDALDPLLLVALVSTGAAITLTAAAAGTGALAIPSTGAAYADLAGLVVMSSVLPLAALWGGIRRIGASTAAIVAAVEPAVTVTLAAVLLGEHLRDVQLLGGALVVGAVVVLHARRSDSVDDRDAAPDAARRPPARPLAHDAA